MTEEENVAETQEEVVNPQEDSQTLQAQTQEAEDKEYNFRQLRESKKQLEERMERLEAELKAARAPKVEEEDDFGISDDDLAEGKHLKKLRNEFKRLEQSIQKNTMEQIPARLQSKFSDFEQVVTKENIEKLQRTEPELYASVISGSDLYAKGVAAYKTLTMLGYSNKSYDSQKEQVQRNSSKPLSTQAVKGTGPIHEAQSFANGLTPELRKQLLKEMGDAAKAR